MVEQLELKNFTCFQDSHFDFCPGINVFIGRNGTGKTHVLKCLCASMKANELFRLSTSKTKDRYGELLADKLSGYFKPDMLGHLVNQYETGNASVRMRLRGGELAYSFGEKAVLVRTENNSYIEQAPFLYIPPREMFSLFEGFISLYERREISLDESYVDLAKAMDAAPLKNGALGEGRRMVDRVLEKWHFEVARHGNRFYVVEEGKELEAHLVAEGIRKVATLVYLVINGELKPGSVLFWDEPEANLNPSLISVMADLLMALAREYGVQVFLSTHDYLLSHKLSMVAEYAAGEGPAMRFFSLYKEAGWHGAEIEVGDTLAEIGHNPILQEYAAFYDLENEFIRKHNEGI